MLIEFLWYFYCCYKLKRKEEDHHFDLQKLSVTGLAGHLWNQTQNVFPPRDHTSKKLKSAASTPEMRHRVESTVSSRCEASFQDQLRCDSSNMETGVGMAAFVIASHE